MRLLMGGLMAGMGKGMVEQDQANRREAEQLREQALRIAENERDRLWRSAEFDLDRSARATEAAADREFRAAEGSADREARAGEVADTILTDEGVSLLTRGGTVRSTGLMPAAAEGEGPAIVETARYLETRLNMSPEEAWAEATKAKDNPEAFARDYVASRMRLLDEGTLRVPDGVDETDRAKVREFFRGEAEEIISGGKGAPRGKTGRFDSPQAVKEAHQRGELSRTEALTYLRLNFPELASGG